MDTTSLSPTELRIFRKYVTAMTGLPFEMFYAVNNETKTRVVETMIKDLNEYYQERKDAESGR